MKTKELTLDTAQIIEEFAEILRNEDTYPDGFSESLIREGYIPAVEVMGNYFDFALDLVKYQVLTETEDKNYTLIELGGEYTGDLTAAARILNFAQEHKFDEGVIGQYIDYIVRQEPHMHHGDGDYAVCVLYDSAQNEVLYQRCDTAEFATETATKAG